MCDDSHYLQLSVLESMGVSRPLDLHICNRHSHLEAFVLQHFFDGNIFLALFGCITRCSPILTWARSFNKVAVSTTDQSCLKDDTKRAIANHLAIGVAQFSLLARLSVRGSHLDHLEGIVHCWVS